jgi:hypothetical protein
MIRGEPAIGRDQSREPRLYSVEPVWGSDHEAVIRFRGQGSEAAGPFSQRHCSHSRMRIAATSDRHRLPCTSSAVSAEPCLSFLFVATGDAVRRPQRGLQRTPNLGLSIDGVFGPKTETAVKDFHQGTGLVADGVVGPLTWAALPKRRSHASVAGRDTRCSGSDRWVNYFRIGRKADADSRPGCRWGLHLRYAKDGYQ